MLVMVVEIVQTQRKVYLAFHHITMEHEQESEAPLLLALANKENSACRSKIQRLFNGGEWSLVLISCHQVFYNDFPWILRSSSLEETHTEATNNTMQGEI